MKKSFLFILFVLILSSFSFGQEPATTPPTNNGIGTGQGSGRENDTSKPVVPTSDKTVWTRILSKPRPNYTDMARKNGVEGVVRLRVTFLATGKIGAVSPVSALPDGLTEQAIAAARDIKFEPATRNRIPFNTVKIVEYNFSFYYGENDEALTKNAEILQMPKPEHPQEADLKRLGGKVKLDVALNSNGSIQIIKVYSDLPKEFEQKAREAASKIKFKPAVHKNGNEVTQTKEIEYEFKLQKN